MTESAVERLCALKSLASFPRLAKESRVLPAALPTGDRADG